MNREISLYARLACMLEVSVAKPGNVHPGAEFDDMSYLDFLLSATAIGDRLEPSWIAEHGVGAVILDAVEATSRVVASNTNLGILLLLVPLAAVPLEFRSLREGLAEVLSNLTLDDARAVYAAIRHARPGGLGSTQSQDIAQEPSVSLLEAMRLAADRDAIARQYATNYEDIFEIGLLALVDQLATGRPLETAIVGCHLRLMAERPDTLIARKRGIAVAEESAARAREVLNLGWPDSAEGFDRLVELDQWLRADGNARNPGTTADLVAAVLFVALREGVISLPLAGRSFTS